MAVFVEVKPEQVEVVMMPILITQLQARPWKVGP